MKVYKIIIGAIAAILIFCLGITYQSYQDSDNEKENVNDSAKVSSSAKEEDSVDIYSP